MLWSLLLKLISGPILSGAIDAYKAKLQTDSDFDKQKVDLASRELIIQSREAELQTQLRIAQIGKWYEPEHIAEYTFVLLLAKIVIYDTMLGWGTTTELHGSAGIWLGMIASFMFAKRGFENIARIISFKK